MSTNVDEYLTPQEVARRRGVSAATIYRAIGENRLPHTRIMGRIAVSIQDADAWSPGQRGGARPNTGRRYQRKPANTA